MQKCLLASNSMLKVGCHLDDVMGCQPGRKLEHMQRV